MYSIHIWKSILKGGISFQCNPFVHCRQTQFHQNDKIGVSDEALDITAWLIVGFHKRFVIVMALYFLFFFVLKVGAFIFWRDTFLFSKHLSNWTAWSNWSPMICQFLKGTPQRPYISPLLQPLHLPPRPPPPFECHASSIPPPRIRCSFIPATRSRAFLPWA